MWVNVTCGVSCAVGHTVRHAGLSTKVGYGGGCAGSHVLAQGSLLGDLGLEHGWLGRPSGWDANPGTEWRSRLHAAQACMSVLCTPAPCASKAASLHGVQPCIPCNPARCASHAPACRVFERRPVEPPRAQSLLQVPSRQTHTFTSNAACLAQSVCQGRGCRVGKLGSE